MIPRRALVRSSSGRTWYRVLLDPEHRDESCSCPAYTFRTGIDADGRCRHLRIAAEQHTIIRWESMASDLGSCSCCSAPTVRGDEDIAAGPPAEPPVRAHGDAQQPGGPPVAPGGVEAAEQPPAASRAYAGAWAVSGTGRPLSRVDPQL